MNDNNPINNTSNDTDIWGRKINSNIDLTIHKNNENDKVEKLDTPNIQGSINNSNILDKENDIEIPALKNNSPKINTFFNDDTINNIQDNQNSNTFFNQEPVITNEEIKQEVSNDINPQINNTPSENNLNTIESNDEVLNLESKSIGTIKKDKQKSPTAMLILFGVLILTIFFIPEITPYFNDILTKLNISDNEEIYETPVKPDDSEDNETEEEIPDEDDVPDIETFPIDLATTVTLDKLNFTNLEKVLIDNTYYFKYTINNTDTENKFDFLTNRIYIDFYQENTYLGRALINIDNIGANSNISLQSVINENVYNNATSIQIVNRNISDYPKSELPNAIITCEAPNRSISYTFNNGKLTNIKDIFNYIKVDDNSFTMNYLNYQTKALKLSEESIATAKVTGIDGGFTYEANINYEEDINLTSHDILYYPKDTTKDIINYEIESLGYTCK